MALDASGHPWTRRALDRQVRLWAEWSDECVAHALEIIGNPKPQYRSPAIEAERAYNLRRRIKRNLAKINRSTP